MIVLGIVLVVVCGGITLMALLAVLHLLVPAPVERARLRLENGLWRPFLVGLVNLVFFGLLVVLFFWLGGRLGGVGAALLALPAGLILLALALFSLNGLAGLTALVGERIGGARTGVWSDLRGALLVLLACLAPYVGWYAFAPFALCLGLGASVLAMFQRKVAKTAEM